MNGPRATICARNGPFPSTLATCVPPINLSPNDTSTRNAMAMCFAQQVLSIQMESNRTVADTLALIYAKQWREFYNTSGRFSQIEVADLCGFHRDVSPLADDMYNILFPCILKTADVNQVLAGAVQVKTLGDAIEVHMHVLLRAVEMLFIAATSPWVPAHSYIVCIIRIAAKAILASQPATDMPLYVASGPVHLASIKLERFTQSNSPPCLWHTIQCCNGKTSGRTCCSVNGRHPLDPERHMIAALLSALQPSDASGAETVLYQQMFGSENDNNTRNTKGFVQRAMKSAANGRPYGITCNTMLTADLCPHGRPTDIEDLSRVQSQCGDRVGVSVVRNPRQVFLALNR